MPFKYQADRMLSVKGYPSHLLHGSFTFTSGFTKRIRLRVFFRTVMDSILHFVNLFPHCYGDARYRIGIFFCTVAGMTGKNGRKIMDSGMKKSDFLTEKLRYGLKKADLHLTSVSVKDVKDSPSHAIR